MRIQIRTHAIQLDAWQEELVLRRVRVAFGRFADQVSRVTVWVAHESDPDLGVDFRSLIEVTLRPSLSVYAEAVGNDAETAAANAARRAARRVRDELARRRLLGIRPRAISTANELELEAVSR